MFSYIIYYKDIVTFTCDFEHEPKSETERNLTFQCQSNTEYDRPIDNQLCISKSLNAKY